MSEIVLVITHSFTHSLTYSPSLPAVSTYSSASDLQRPNSNQLYHISQIRAHISTPAYSTFRHHTYSTINIVWSVALPQAFPTYQTYLKPCAIVR